jgi:hypothetical protein
MFQVILFAILLRNRYVLILNFCSIFYEIFLKKIFFGLSVGKLTVFDTIIAPYFNTSLIVFSSTAV